MKVTPDRHLEEQLHAQGYRLLAGMDEVGRGALAGPVSVGVVIVDPDVGPAPAGLKDSKLLTPAARNALVEPVRVWARAAGVGHASAPEIDRFGIIGGLCLAGHRALAQAQASGLTPELVLLDGVHDWLSAPRPCELPTETPQVLTQVKGDLRVAAIAAASILAKVERDELMTQEHDAHPAYGWNSNKGYGSALHRAALSSIGASPLHRLSWNLPRGPQPGPSGPEPVSSEPQPVQGTLLED